VGEARARHASVRIVSAANVDLAERVRVGAFREDLWYRLAAGVIGLPPLRERGEEDLLALAHHFLEEAAAGWQRPAARLARDAERALCAWPWPGNVRELRAEMRRAALEARHGRILAEHLSIRGATTAPVAGTLRSAQSENARRVIGTALRHAGGNRTRAASALGISRQALLSRIQRLGL
jgi:DNA-binding NtrC family response regulator